MANNKENKQANIIENLIIDEFIFGFFFFYNIFGYEKKNISQSIQNKETRENKNKENKIK